MKIIIIENCLKCPYIRYGTKDVEKDVGMCRQNGYRSLWDTIQTVEIEGEKIKQQIIPNWCNLENAPVELHTN